LALPELLNTGPEEFGVYQEEIKNFLKELQPVDQARLCQNYYETLEELVHEIPSGENSLTNLIGFCEMMDDLSPNHNRRWIDFVLTLYESPIRDAVKREAKA